MRGYRPTHLSSFINQANRIPRLSADEERELATRWRDHGDRKAADRIVSAHLRFVVALATKYRRYRVPMADLVSEGCVGLLQALEKFEPDRGFRFVTYATFWIRARMVDCVLRGWSIVRSGSPALSSKIFFRLRRERARLESQLGEGPAVREALAAKLGVTASEVAGMLQRIEGVDVSLDAPLFDDGGATMVDTLASRETGQDVVCAEAETSSRAESVVSEALETLDPRERFIAENRLMADGDEELSLAEIGRRMGVSRERARQIEARAKKKLRTRIERLCRRQNTTPVELGAAA